MILFSDANLFNYFSYLTSTRANGYHVRSSADSIDNPLVYYTLSPAIHELDQDLQPKAWLSLKDRGSSGDER